MLNSKFIIILILSGLLGFLISFFQNKNNEVLQPELTMKTIRVSHSPLTLVKQLVDDPSAGEKIFKEFCASCHGRNRTIDIDAPRIGDQKLWNKLRKWGVSTLLAVTVKGVGVMPARGGCFECSDQQLRQAIEYILESSI